LVLPSSIFARLDPQYVSRSLEALHGNGNLLDSQGDSGNWSRFGTIVDVV